MAKPTIAEVENSLDELNLDAGYDLIFDLLVAYGIAKSTIAKAKKKESSTNKAKETNQLLNLVH